MWRQWIPNLFQIEPVDKFTWVNLLLICIRPYQTLDYLRIYFMIVKLMRQGYSYLILWLFCIFSIIRFVQVIMPITMQLPPQQRELQLDMIYLAGMPDWVNYINVLALLLGIYFYYHAFVVCAHSPITRSIFDLLYLDKSDYFIFEWIVRKRRRQRTIHRMRYTALIIINCNQYIVFMIDVVVVMTQMLLFKNYWSQANQYTTSLLIQIVLFVAIELNAFYFYAFSYASIHCYNMMLSLVMITATMGYLRLLQSVALIQESSVTSCYRRRGSIKMVLLRFIHHHLDSLWMVGHVNRVYGRMLLALIVLLTPVTSTMLLMLMLRRIVPEAQTAYAQIIFSIYASLLSQFYLAIKFPGLIHEPAKRLMSLTLQYKEHYDLRERLKVVNFCQHFHTTNQYGITYGPLGLIQRSSVVEFVGVKLQILMYFYALFEARHAQ